MAQKPTKRRSAADQDKIIVEALRGVGRPVSAYELIEQVRGKGVSAPPSVYRALLRLIEKCRAGLQQKALQLGLRLYEEQPAVFTARIEKYWREWRAGSVGMLHRGE